MLKLLKSQYGLQADDEVRIGKYKAYRSQEQIYILVPIGGMTEDELSELNMLTDHLVKSGEKYCGTIIKTKEGKQFSEWENGRYCVLMNKQVQNRKLQRSGRKLAKFHFRGRSVSFPVKKVSRIGQWKQLWETRLDQMEKVWNEMLFQQPEHEFDQMFLESFPYYRGIAENAIQYIVDTEIDDNPGATDSGTICHIRFTEKIWDHTYYMKNPFDWVFDHSSRDLAEWTREKYFRNIKTYEPVLRQFMKDYQSIVPLTPFSWRLYFARLLFPLHYFYCIETYYGSSSEQEKNTLEERLHKFLQQSDEHERFLGSFYDFAEVPVQKFRIPLIGWLKK
ncbi:spore coat protein YutH [Bacillus sp. DTU_2020_1000418_1_SI_GHA_SEK_038]|uniref:spore coat putative kinase YutH n=1 Tax=Bacillus sp. DTU_2020_1000418_1_SI_GHA_SEK_038 TaxID=3077585 RepID=UPI0028EF42FD|nr:spore coat protein YutH [Bacillus sp. DTU_2020_1000418_1_SI_GHA_SEK_038]WNS74810.1 spore coat protein YutH [Bacillus sp. DTU_2020_1000418_1_SI_GHA_SEK_038]